LEFILIVGSEPAKTLANKLKNLEIRTKIPTRFCKASDIAHLREKILGPIPFMILEKRILEAPSIMPGNWFDEIVDWVESKNKRYASFVEEELL